MRFLYGLVLVLPLAALTPAPAADAAKRNTLTPQEVADGWLLLFDGEPTFGWKIDGESRVVDGTLVLGGEKPCRARLTTEFGSCSLQLEHLPYEGRDKAKVTLGTPTAGAVSGATYVVPPTAKGTQGKFVNR